MNRKIKISFDIIFIFLLSIVPSYTKVFDKYFIELPQSFYLNLSLQAEKPLELWHPRLILSQIVDVKGNTQVINQEKRIGLLKETVYKGSSSFLEISSKIIRKNGFARSFLEISSEASTEENYVKSNKMSCACKFIPEYANSNGVEGNKQIETAAKTQENPEETVLLQTEDKTHEKKKFNEKNEQMEKIEHVNTVNKKPENTKKTTISSKTKDDVEEKELWEMYQKLDKIFKSKEDTQEPIETLHNEVDNQKLNIIQQKPPVIQQQQRPIYIQSQPSPYVLQPIALQSNLQYSNYQEIQPKTPAYQYVNYDDINPITSSYAQDNVKYVVLPNNNNQRPQQQVLYIPQRQQNQQIVYVNSNGEIIQGY